MRLVVISGTALSQHMTSRVNRSVHLFAHLTVEMAYNTDLIPASSGLLYLLTVLTCPNVVSKYCLLLLKLVCTFSCPV